MDRAGLSRAAVCVDDLRTQQAAHDAVAALMASDWPPTALFTSQNMITIGAVRALHELRLQHTVALVGFDDVPLGDVLDPGVTVMAQDPARIGAIAAERVFARMDGDHAPAETIVVPTTLLVRGSGEISPPE
jgi:LacI family transcriptional regulator